MSKITEEEAKADPERYRILESGAIQDRETSFFVGHTGNGIYAITPERSRELWQQRQVQKIRSDIAGRIDAARKYLEDKKIQISIPNPDDLTDEELIQAEGDADRLVTKLFILAFLKESDKVASDQKGGNFRGLAEGYRAAKGENLRDSDRSGIAVNIQANFMSADLARTITQIVTDVMTVKQIVDVEARDIPEAHLPSTAGAGKPFGGRLTTQQGEE